MNYFTEPVIHLIVVVGTRPPIKAAQLRHCGAFEGRHSNPPLPILKFIGSSIGFIYPDTTWVNVAT
jgi:hypothetical protein